MQAQGYRSIDDTIGTLFLILLGEFDFEEMQKVHPVWALVSKPRAVETRGQGLSPALLLRRCAAAAANATRLPPCPRGCPRAPDHWLDVRSLLRSTFSSS